MKVAFLILGFVAVAVVTAFGYLAWQEVRVMNARFADIYGEVRTLNAEVRTLNQFGVALKNDTLYVELPQPVVVTADPRFPLPIRGNVGVDVSGPVDVSIAKAVTVSGNVNASVDGQIRSMVTVTEPIEVKGRVGITSTIQAQVDIMSPVKVGGPVRVIGDELNPLHTRVSNPYYPRNADPFPPLRVEVVSR